MFGLRPEIWLIILSTSSFAWGSVLGSSRVAERVISISQDLLRFKASRCGPFLANSSEIVKKSPEQIRLEQEIRGLEPLLREKMISLQLAYNDSVCSGVCLLLLDLIEEHLHISPEIVTIRFNTPLTGAQICEHTFLRIPDFYGRGQPAYIDPTFTQFNPAAALAMPFEQLIFVGTPAEMLAALDTIGYDSGLFLKAGSGVETDFRSLAWRRTWESEWRRVLSVVRRTSGEVHLLTPLRQCLSRKRK
ncbi:MAG: hypothetical protein AB7G93_06855 [Bdellovibrionales bacterium]